MNQHPWTLPSRVGGLSVVMLPKPLTQISGVADVITGSAFALDDVGKEL